MRSSVTHHALRWWVLAALLHGLLACGAAPPPPAAPPKLALLVGVNHYPSEQIPELEGAVNDTENMARLLMDRYGFHPANVRILKDAEATRAGILTAFRSHLVERAMPGSQVVFHFSGHGAQVFDRSGDELDRWDETLVPHDARREGDPAGDILDDELQGLVKALVTRGAHPTLILDSCHSGTAVREGVTARGLPPSGPGGGPKVTPDEVALEMPRGYTLISAAGSAERAHEVVDPDGHAHGGLTWFLTRALRQGGPHMTWRGAVARATADLSTHFPGQRPRLEGTGLDAPPFSHRADPSTPWRQRFVARGGARERGPIELKAGTLHGVTPGTLFGLYPVDEPLGPNLLEGKLSEEGQLGRMIVTQSDLMGSAGRLTQGRCPDVCQAVELSRPLATVRFPVFLEGPEAQWVDLLEALKPWPQVEVVEQPGRARAHLRLTTSGISINLPGQGGELTGQSVLQAAAHLLMWARWLHLMEAPDGGALPVDISIEPPLNAEAVPPGTRLELVVQNNSARRVYLSVLSLADDGAITLVYPAPGAQEYLDPGRLWRRPIQLGLPEGREETLDLLRVLATPSPVDLAAVEQPPQLSPPGTRGAPSLAGWLMWSATRGGPTSVEAHQWAMRSVAVTVKLGTPPPPPKVKP